MKTTNTDLEILNGYFARTRDNHTPLDSVEAYKSEYGDLECQDVINECARVTIKTKALQMGYHMFGNKGACWSGKVHIAASGLGESGTLCNTPMLSTNWARIWEHEEVGCPECIWEYERRTKTARPETKTEWWSLVRKDWEEEQRDAQSDDRWPLMEYASNLGEVYGWAYQYDQNEGEHVLTKINK